MQQRDDDEPTQVRHEEQERASEAREVAAREGVESQGRDHRLVRLDQREIRARMIEAFDHYVSIGFEVHLIATEDPARGRDTVDYKLVLADDGNEDITPLTRVQEIANEYRLDVYLQKGIRLLLLPRW